MYKKTFQINSSLPVTLPPLHIMKRSPCCNQKWAHFAVTCGVHITCILILPCELLPNIRISHQMCLTSRCVVKCLFISIPHFSLFANHCLESFRGEFRILKFPNLIPSLNFCKDLLYWSPLQVYGYPWIKLVRY